VSDDKEKAQASQGNGKHAEPEWPEDTGRTFDDWLEQSNKEAEGK